MYWVLIGLATISGIGAFVCYILVLVKMFQKNDTTMAIVSIVTLVCCGIGILFNLVYGWVKATEWNLKNVMLVYSVCVGLNILFYVAAIPFAPVVELGPNRTFQPVGNSLTGR